MACMLKVVLLFHTDIIQCHCWRKSDIITNSLVWVYNLKGIGILSGAFNRK